MIERIGDECCGCGACKNICPKKCIKMVKNEMGFYYPSIDKSNCIGCNICENTCPVINADKVDSLKKAYLVRNKNDEILINSASGGFFSAIGEYIVENGGYICGAVFDDDWTVKHYLSFSLTDLPRFRGSKYVQSDLGECFKQISGLLMARKSVLFCGTPCQVKALKLYTKKSKNKDYLLTVDVVCKGVGSPGLWNNYLKTMMSKYDSNINYINFRKKVNGYHSSNMVVSFDNGKKSSKSKTDLYMRAYVNELCSRNSCYKCSFKGVNRCSDFTIFDAWHAHELGVDIDDDRGYTSIICHNKKADNLSLSLNEKLEICEIDIDKAIHLDGVMINYLPISNKNRIKFLQEGCSIGIDKSMKKYYPIKIKDFTTEFLKSILHSLGLLQTVKRTLHSFKN